MPIAQPSAPPGAPLLELEGVHKSFYSKELSGKTRRVVAAEAVSFRIEQGQAVALVGESGSGKSTIAKLILRLEVAERGAIRLEGADLLKTEPRRASLAFRSRVQMIFQDPFGSLNPIHTVGHHIMRPLLRHGKAGGDPRATAIELCQTVGLEPAAELIDRYPDQLSGGQRQRVAIARALAVEPDLVVADEPTSMLDVSLRMDILRLLADLKTERRLAILLITHDLASARYLADRILVLYRGRIVEDGPCDQVVDQPRHPYTRALIAAIAGVDGEVERQPATRPVPAAGCPFTPRCPDAMERCESIDPSPVPVDQRLVRCHLYSAD